MTFAKHRRLWLLVAALLPACSRHEAAPRLEKTDDEDVAIPNVPVPPENAPRLGSIADQTPVFDRPSRRGRQIGYLHAGATVARSAEPISTCGCEGGWFAVRPSGFVCASGSATTDLRHPTLAAMAILPALDHALPFVYARVKAKDTSLFAADPSKDDGVTPLSTLRAKSGVAVVGSWTASDPSGAALRLAMTTDGHFVPASDVEAATPSDFHGVELGEHDGLPLAFVVKRGVRAWTFHDDEPEKQGALDYHARIALTGHSHTVSGSEFWATTDDTHDRWVRAQDVTLIRERHELPEFATDGQKWIDVSVVTGALVAYEGKKPVFATLVSVGRDRLGAPESNAATQRGDFKIVGKEVTAVGRDPSTFTDGISIYDVPWALELSSGQLMVGAYWHDRFGIEHGPGNIELSPPDAARLFRWVDPELPAGWHGVTEKREGAKTTIVEVRK